MAWGQMEKDNKSGKFSKLLKERIKSSWEKLGEVSAAMGEASEERPDLLRTLWAYKPRDFQTGLYSMCLCSFFQVSSGLDIRIPAWSLLWACPGRESQGSNSSHILSEYMKGPMCRTPSPPSPPCLSSPEVEETHLINTK